MLDSGLFGGRQIGASACGDCVASVLLAFTSLGNNGPTLTPLSPELWTHLHLGHTDRAGVEPAPGLCSEWWRHGCRQYCVVGFEDLCSVYVETCRSGHVLVLHPPPY